MMVVSLVIGDQVEEGLVKRMRTLTQDGGRQGSALELFDSENSIEAAGSVDAAAPGEEDEFRYGCFVAEEKETGKVVGMVELGILPCPVPLKRRPPPPR